MKPTIPLLVLLAACSDPSEGDTVLWVDTMLTFDPPPAAGLYVEASYCPPPPDPCDTPTIVLGPEHDFPDTMPSGVGFRTYLGDEIALHSGVLYLSVRDNQRHQSIAFCLHDVATLPHGEPDACGDAPTVTLAVQP